MINWNVALGGVVMILSILYFIQSYKDYKRKEIGSYLALKGFGAGFFGFLLGLFMLLGKVTFF